MLSTEPPKLVLKIREREFHSYDDLLTIYVNLNETFVAECHAIDARPAVSLTWTVNDETVDATMLKHESIKKGKYTYTTTSAELIMKFESNEGNITCTSFSHKETKYPVNEVVITVEYKTFGKRNEGTIMSRMCQLTRLSTFIYNMIFPQ